MAVTEPVIIETKKEVTVLETRDRQPSLMAIKEPVIVQNGTKIEPPLDNHPVPVLTINEELNPDLLKNSVKNNQKPIITDDSPKMETPFDTYPLLTMYEELNPDLSKDSKEKPQEPSSLTVSNNNFHKDDLKIEPPFDSHPVIAMYDKLRR